MTVWSPFLDVDDSFVNGIGKIVFVHHFNTCNRSLQEGIGEILLIFNADTKCRMSDNHLTQKKGKRSDTKWARIKITNVHVVATKVVSEIFVPLHVHRAFSSFSATK